MLRREEAETERGIQDLRVEIPGGRRKSAANRCRFLDAQFATSRLAEQAAGTSGGDDFNAAAINETQFPIHRTCVRRDRQPVAVGQIIRGIPCSDQAEFQDRPAQAQSTAHDRDAWAADPGEGKAAPTAEAGRSESDLR